ncbi:hypothetical protein [Paenibacillus solani]|uniref:hypothetical protein n=1 Tax=Paenibacillus solani TaxID=1705565 RepID=UPI000B086148|nr:hypothetical protein [Paenibacillus solani]
MINKKVLLSLTTALTLVSGVAPLSASAQTSVLPISERVNASEVINVNASSCKAVLYRLSWKDYPKKSDVPKSVVYQGETYYLYKITIWEDDRGTDWSRWDSEYRNSACN